MSAYEVCDKLVDAIKSDKYDVIIINFANPDMVGHTGVEDAAIKAVEAVDECVGKNSRALKKLMDRCLSVQTTEMQSSLIDYETGEPFTAHTTNPVPFILVNADPCIQIKRGRMPCRYRSYIDRVDGNGTASRDDRKIFTCKIINRQKFS